MSLSSSLQILKHKEFRLFVFARFFLTLAIQMQMSTINLQIYYEYSKEEIILGMIGLTEALPFIATSFFSGHIADIISRRRILLIGCTALLLGSLFLFGFSNSLFTWVHSFGMYALFAVVFVFGIIRSFLAVSTHPFMSQIIPRELYTQSATWNSTAWHIGSILGPVRHSILQLSTPDEMRGRVAAVNSIFIGSSNEIGAFESGVAARLMGLVPSIAFGGVMTILVVLGVHKLNPKLKELDITKLE